MTADLKSGDLDKSCLAGMSFQPQKHAATTRGASRRLLCICSKTLRPRTPELTRRAGLSSSEPCLRFCLGHAPHGAGLEVLHPDQGFIYRMHSHAALHRCEHKLVIELLLASLVTVKEFLQRSCVTSSNFPDAWRGARCPG